MFIHITFFKATVSKSSLAPFFATVPIEQYCFIVPESEESIYGCFASMDDLLEYFTNEFPVKELQIINTAVFKEVRTKGSYKVWGSRDLLDSM